MTHQRYPSDWPSLIQLEDEKCPDISGTYVNEGEMTNKTYVYLSDIFGKTKIYSSPQEKISLGTISIQLPRHDIPVTHVEINQSNGDTLQILFWKNDKLVDKSIYSKEYTCTPEGITIRLASGVSFPILDAKGITPVIMGSLTVDIRKNKDGELVIRYTSSSMGLAFFVVPVAGSASDYFRFKQKH
jgi:hypothetical protein